MKVYKLNNGKEMPAIGLGTWLIDNDDVVDVVKRAIKLGYTHIDTAQAYGNEEGIGKAIRESGIKREELFITSKIAAEHKTYESAKSSIDETLAKMGLDFVDQMIIHAPQPWAEFRENNNYDEANIEVWRALEDAYTEGKVKSIGVSNFLNRDLENILRNCKIKPMTNQVLAHISNTPFEVIDFCKENDIQVVAYSPLAHGEVVKNNQIISMAKKYNVSVAQLCIRYILELGLVAIPKASSPKYLVENLKVDFEISKDDMEILKNTEKIKSYGKDDFFPVFKKGK